MGCGSRGEEGLDAGFESRDGGESALVGAGGDPSRVGLARETSLTGGPGGGDDLGLLLEKFGLSLRISVPRMGFTSDAMGW